MSPGNNTAPDGFGLLRRLCLGPVAGSQLSRRTTTETVVRCVSPVRGPAEAAPSGEAPFLTENDAAMSKMMSGMSVRPTGDIDHDFVELMASHHQDAIDMAQALLRYCHNQPVRRLAQEIIVTQQQEIAAMRLVLGQPLPPSVAAADQTSGVSAAAVPPALPR